MVVMDLAKTLRVSATPVREALSRLSGEGLVEEHRGRGFSAPRLDPADLGSLHNLHGVYIATALIWREGRQERVILSKPERGAEGATARVGAKGDTVGYRQRALTEQLWIGVVEAVDNRALKRHQQQVNDKLAVARLVEPQIFADLASELDYLSQFAGAEASSAFRNAATDYHRRRFEASNLIAHCIRDTFHVWIKILQIYIVLYSIEARILYVATMRHVKETVMTKLPKLIRLGDAKRLTHGIGFGSIELNYKPVQKVW
jgi:hypothetical protein